MSAPRTLRLGNGPGAPLRAGGAGPLRVATGGDANWSSTVRRRRRPARPQKRRGHAPGGRAPAVAEF